MPGHKKWTSGDMQDSVQPDFPLAARVISEPGLLQAVLIKKISGNMTRPLTAGHRKLISGEKEDILQSGFLSEAKGISELAKLEAVVKNRCVRAAVRIDMRR